MRICCYKTHVIYSIWVYLNMGYPLRKMNILGYIPIVEQTNIYNIYIYKHKSIFDTICLSNLAMENGKFLYDFTCQKNP